MTIGSSAERTRTIKSLFVAGLISLALLAVGESAPAAFPVAVSIRVVGDEITVNVDSEQHDLPASVRGDPAGIVWDSLQFEQPPPLDREYQVDGTDTTVAEDRDTQVISALQPTPLYRFDAWLRDEGSYSEWQSARLLEPTTGQILAQGVSSVQQAGLPPSSFEVDAALRRPEAAARLWLVGHDANGPVREGLELDRDKRNARWLIAAGNAPQRALPRWFFPEQPLPFLAGLAELAGRGAAAGFALLLAGCTLAWCASRWAPWSRIATARHAWAAALTGVVAAWTVAAVWITVVLYRQLPHVLDAVSYFFQAGILRSGRLWLDPPPGMDALKGPFQVVRDGKWFSQYPPGASAAYALGELVGLGWLVGPLGALALILATAWTARHWFGTRAGIVTFCLGSLSPFILFQAGSFLSHPVVGGWLALALAAFAYAEDVLDRRRARLAWVGVGALLGAAFVTREAAAALFALPMLVWLLAHRRLEAVGFVALGGVPFLAAYGAYDAALTGNPFLLPRVLFDPSDHFGFGDGVGFHGRHTFAAGLSNADELLTLLQFDLFGWPPLFLFGFLWLPILFIRRAGAHAGRDVMIAGGFLVFVLTFIGFYSHGIALGPRYYYESVPWLLLLTTRGIQVAAHQAGALIHHPAAARAAAGAVLLALSLNTVFFYLPRQVARRTEFAYMPDGREIGLPFVRTTLSGAVVTSVPQPSVVLVGDWWLFNVVLSPLNCATLDHPTADACPVLFTFAPDQPARDRIPGQYPDRTVLHVVEAPSPTASKQSVLSLAPGTG